ncbi:hypothetical protein CGRA01v4_09396 [Colletotrichum graminicola]|nr:hypothetical protein CGRA01v4_09396 [Colletotrichum graminicola]
MNTSGAFSRGCAKPKRAQARPTGQSCDLQSPRRSAGVRLHRQHQAAPDWTRHKKDGRGEGTATRRGAPSRNHKPAGSGVWEPGICFPYRASLNWPPVDVDVDGQPLSTGRFTRGELVAST